MQQVPCGVFHTRGSRLPFPTRLWRIVAYNVRFLPSAAAPPLGFPERRAEEVEWTDDRTYEAWLTGVYLNRELEWR